MTQSRISAGAATLNKFSCCHKQQEMGKLMQCVLCGAKLKPGETFCSCCGAKLQPAATSEAFQKAAPAADITKYPTAGFNRLLMLGTLVLGFIFQALLYSLRQSIEDFALFYAGFWLAYLVLFHALCYKQTKVRPLGYLFAFISAYLCIMLVFQAYGYSDEMLALLNLPAIPCLLMLHAQYVTQPLPKEQESSYIKLIISGFFIQPFRYLGRFFSVFSFMLPKSGKRKGVVFGILVALPVVAIVLKLLLSADAVMGLYAKTLLDSFKLSELLLRLALLLGCAMLFYSFLYGAAWGEKHVPKPFVTMQWHVVSPAIILGALLFVYMLFSFVQFVYLFGGYGLPEGLTYSEYAREGFGQLIFVAIINYSVFALFLCNVQKGRLLKVLLALLLLATGIILASAFTRLMLYIGAYGLTFKRIQALWLISYVAAVLILCFVRLLKEKLPLLSICTLLFIIWYAALNAPDLTAWYPAV